MIEGVQVTSLEQLVQQAVSLGQQLLPRFPGMDAGGRVRKHGQGGGFAPGQFVGGAPEIAPGRCFQPDDIPTERGMGGIQGEDFIFAAARLQAGCLDGFDGFLPKGPFLAARQADDLHGQRAAAAGDVSRLDIPDQGPSDGYRIDAGVPSEIPVFKLDEGRGEFLRNRVPGRKPPLSVRRDPGPEQIAVPVLDDGGIRNVPKERPWQAAEPGQQHQRGRNGQDTLSGRFFHRVTTAVPEAVLAATRLSYMASQVTGGSRNDPSYAARSRSLKVFEVPSGRSKYQMQASSRMS